MCGCVCMCGFRNVWVWVFVCACFDICVGFLVIFVLLFTVFCIVCTVVLNCFFYYTYSYLFCLYWCKDYCHRVTLNCSNNNNDTPLCAERDKVQAISHRHLAVKFLFLCRFNIRVCENLSGQNSAKRSFSPSISFFPLTVIPPKLSSSLLQYYS
jgi:hypothetical protein